jgi:L-serine dehydratase
MTPDAAAYPELFNDVFGPVMQPGSSSHTAAPCRLGRLAGDLLGEPAADIRIQLDERGSFAGTFGVMSEDRAMVAGVLGLGPDDVGLFRAFELAAEAGAAVAFEFTHLAESAHPNAMKFVLTGRSGRTVTLVGTSTGGGMVETLVVDGFPLRTIGDAYVVLVFEADPALTPDPALAARLAAPLHGLVATTTAAAAGRGRLHAFSLSAEPDARALETTLAAAVAPARLTVLRPVLPVLRRADRAPQLFDTMTRWREIAEQRGEALWETVLQYEIDASGWSRDEIVATMARLAALMHRQTHAAYDEDTVVPASPFKPDFTAPWARHVASGRSLTGGVVAETIKLAYGAGAGIPGVETVPGPMGGGGGYLYAALAAVRDARGLSDDDLLHGLLVAGGVGAIAFSRTEPTGEVIGCTGEAGVCGAMAAAGIAAMVGATPRQTEDAASLALQAFTGMPCDPIPGGLCQPCRSRILAATCTAHVFADLALAGHAAVLPFHEALDAADAIGRALPADLLCTSRGGACATPTAARQRAAFAEWLRDVPPELRPPGNLI